MFLSIVVSRYRTMSWMQAWLNDQTTQTKYPASFVPLDKRELRWNGPRTEDEYEIQHRERRTSWIGWKKRKREFAEILQKANLFRQRTSSQGKKSLDYRRVHADKNSYFSFFFSLQTNIRGLHLYVFLLNVLFPTYNIYLSTRQSSDFSRVAQNWSRYYAGTKVR